MLAHHMQQAHYTWRQQEHIMNLTQGFKNSFQQKTTLYWDASKTSTPNNIPHTTTGAMGPHHVGSPSATPIKTTKIAVGPKRVGNPANMTTTNPYGKTWGPSHELKPVCSPWHYRNLYSV